MFEIVASEIPPVYSPPISEAVSDYACKVASQAIARGDFGDVIDSRADLRPLYQHVRAVMGRASVRDTYGVTLDDESISDGIVRAILRTIGGLKR